MGDGGLVEPYIYKESRVFCSDVLVIRKLGYIYSFKEMIPAFLESKAFI